MATDTTLRYSRLITLARDYCVEMENSHTRSRHEFVNIMAASLPLIYAEFLSLKEDELDDGSGMGFQMQYLAEEAYDEVRIGVARILGEDDIYLETVSEEMKYSDTPIAASISENLTDIYQALFNCITAIRESEGLQASEALFYCKEAFDEYWSQTLCNVLRAINPLRNAIDPAEFK